MATILTGKDLLSILVLFQPPAPTGYAMVSLNISMPTKKKTGSLSSIITIHPVLQAQAFIMWLLWNPWWLTYGYLSGIHIPLGLYSYF